MSKPSKRSRAAIMAGFTTAIVFAAATGCRSSEPCSDCDRRSIVPGITPGQPGEPATDAGDGPSGKAPISDDDEVGLRAFPGAQGFAAKTTTGGRGGRVLKVTTLNPKGPGSLEWAVSQPGPRIVVFAVSGVIDSPKIEIPHGDLTIAGQTAPGAGITIAGQLFSNVDDAIQNVIVRHVRIRPQRATGSQGDAIQFSRGSRFIFDHVSVSWGCDETIDLYEARDVTVQWSTIEQASTNCSHPDGTQHNYGLINGPEGRQTSIHHNLFVNNLNRNPAIANGPAEIRNNVVHNVKHAFVHHNPAKGQFNIVGNYYRRGPNASLIPFYFDDEDRGSDVSLGYFLADNFIDDPGSKVGSVDNPWTTPLQHPSFDDLVAPVSRRAASAFDFTKVSGYLPIVTQSSTEALALVAARVGAFPRDVVTRRSLDELAGRKGAWGARLPLSLLEGLTPTEPPADRDNDGIADAWEQASGLDPDQPSDATKAMPSGYTAVETYINELAAKVITR